MGASRAFLKSASFSPLTRPWVPLYIEPVSLRGARAPRLSYFAACAVVGTSGAGADKRRQFGRFGPWHGLIERQGAGWTWEHLIRLEMQASAVPLGLPPLPLLPPPPPPIPHMKHFFGSCSLHLTLFAFPTYSLPTRHGLHLGLHLALPLSPLYQGHHGTSHVGRFHHIVRRPSYW
jgi:hypothetical protein